MNHLPVSANCGASAATDAALVRIAEAALDTNYVSLGSRRTASVHEFYRYPARFSPLFARAVIDALTRAGDLVVDPFVGGGTTVVEAQRSARRAAGSDLSSLAVFVSRAKTTMYSARGCAQVKTWADAVRDLRLGEPSRSAPDESGPEGRALSTASTWRLRRFIGTALDSLVDIEPPEARALARCAVLRTAQWALDMKEDTPAIAVFRDKLAAHAAAMADVADAFREEVMATSEMVSPSTPFIRQRSAADLTTSDLPSSASPRLVLTSPPYPGVYVNYHRWKIRGRKETGAPFWIAGCPDGHGLAHYTMGARADRSGTRYFDGLELAWKKLAQLVRADAWIVQLVGFSEPREQLPRYLDVMRRVGFVEQLLPPLANSADQRLWRSVPGRRWWVAADARTAAAPATAREVVLFHRLDSRSSPSVR